MEEPGRLYSLALWAVKPGRETDFVAAWKSFAEWTMENQPGSVGDARLVQEVDKPQRFISFGAWEDAQKLQSWRDRPEFKAFFGKAKELCEDIQPRTLRTVASVESASASAGSR